jgi:hypothetical protein
MVMDEDAITITNDSASAVINRGQAVLLGLDFEAPSGATGALLFYACRTRNGTFKALLDPVTGSQVTVPTGFSAASWVPAPVYCAHAPFLQIRFTNNVTASLRVFRGS